MVGSPDAPGMIPRAMQQIFESSKRLEGQGWSFGMAASMLEIYNEEYKGQLGAWPAHSRSTTKSTKVGRELEVGLRV